MSGYAAVVLYYRAGPVLADTLDALGQQTEPPAEVLVVDNASGDGVAPRTVRGRPGVRLLMLERNEGYAGGMNRGIAALGPRFAHVLLLTHEVTLAHGAVAELLSAAEDRSASACGPLLRRRSDGTVWSAGGTLSANGATGHLSSPRPPSGEPYEVAWLDGAAMLVNAEAFRQIGGFDERFFLYWEDVDISVRLRHRGPVLCVPTATATQETGLTPPYYASRNRVLFWRKQQRWGPVVRAIRGEILSAARELARPAPRLRDAGSRMLGVLDGLTGQLHPRLARWRTRSD